MMRSSIKAPKAVADKAWIDLPVGGGEGKERYLHLVALGLDGGTASLRLHKTCYEAGGHSQLFVAVDAVGSWWSAKRFSLKSPKNSDGLRSGINQIKQRLDNAQPGLVRREMGFLQRSGVALASQTRIYESRGRQWPWPPGAEATKIWQVSPLMAMDMLNWVRLLESRPQDERPLLQLRLQICNYVLRQVLRELVTCHGHNVAHGDVRAENLLCGRIGASAPGCFLWDFDRAYTIQAKARAVAVHQDLSGLALVAMMLLDPSLRGKLEDSEAIACGLERLTEVYGLELPSFVLQVLCTEAADCPGAAQLLAMLNTTIPRPQQLSLAIDFAHVQAAPRQDIGEQRQSLLASFAEPPSWAPVTVHGLGAVARGATIRLVE